MHLKKIKLSGFKSFVDPITIPFEGKLIGIVGPNGCGKSNIIDAVRWVMGESSAKHLRGDSMADVVFSGSTARKPVSKASVELIFDNADGGAPGQYAGFAEISIRREAGRDGQSDYFLNKTKCRRKDIIDLFLGTGAGPHAYSIIEQGMVTRIIESKPEELRGLFEEAAGVSRYKERRRETENRIRHTRENLARVEDIRKELETQLNRLQRQARAAERYKELKQEERLTRAQLIALRWQGLTTRMEEQEGTIRGMETAVEGAIAGLRGIEAEIERIRVGQTEANDRFNAVQGEFYAAGAEIANIEQAIEHARTTREERQRELEQLNAGWSEASRHLELDRERIETLTRTLAEAGPAHAASQKAREESVSSLAAAEQAMQAWQQDWEHFGNEQSEIQRVRDIQQSRLQSLARQLAQLGERRARLEEELKTLADEVRGEDIEALRRTAQGHDETCEKLERELEEREQAIRNQREQIAQQTRNIQTLRGDQQRDAARLASLRELQAAALGQHNSGLNEWLQRAGLSATPRLAKHLRVEAGWEKAVERALGSDLAAICVPKIDGLSTSLAGLNQADVTLLETGVPVTAAAGGAQRLIDKVSSDMPVAGLLDGIYVAESLNDAMARRGSLASHESIITRDGAWVGCNWLSVAHEDSARAGMIGRERDIQTIEAALADLNTRIETGQAGLAEAQRVLVAVETQRDEQRRLLQDTHRERAAFKSRLGHHEALVAKVSARRAQIETELQEVVAQIARDDQEQAGSRELLANAEQQYATLEDRRSALLSRRDSCRSTLDEARRRATDTSDALHRIEVERESQRTALSSTQAGLARLEQQLAQLTERRAAIEQALAAAGDPESGLRQRLDSHLATRVAIEQRLGAARSQVSDLDAALREQEQARARQEHEIEERRQAVNDQRVARQELLVRRDTLLEQLRETEHALEEIQAAIPPEATEESWLARVTEIEGKISRLGAINLMAIEEFREQSERKGYLDKQYDDLSQALATLEDAIQKIDRETRTRFKETFDKVNTGFQTIFPKLFGGGHAYLELIGEDILDTGVRVMARPPGKRNSTIHLLSGGEKALTAVSLLFSLFELNPAPFCLLDEVDAPLDDANVVRYSDMLKAFSQKTQLIYITHNKISMEIAELLVGVTMSEPGVSRLVAVDVDQALEMVAQ